MGREGRVVDHERGLPGAVLGASELQGHGLADEAAHVQGLLALARQSHRPRTVPNGPPAVTGRAMLL